MRINTNFRHEKSRYNTFIGGVAATIGTAALLATKLGISAGRISNFQIVGADIRCKISGGTYVMPASTWMDNNSITYFDDKGGLVAGLNDQTFRRCGNLTYVNLPKVAYMTHYNFDSCPLTGIINFPSCTSLSGTNQFYTLPAGAMLTVNFPALVSLTSNNFFAKFSSSKQITINVPLSLKTSNGGLPNVALTSTNLYDTIVNYIGYTDTTDYTTKIGFITPSTWHKGTLSYALGIGSGAIDNYQIIGNELRFNLTVGFTLKQNAFNSSSTITYFDDSLSTYPLGITDVGNDAIYACNNLTSVKLYALRTINGTDFLRSCPVLTTFEAPDLRTIGSNGQYICRNSPGISSVSFPLLTNIYGAAFYGDGNSIKDFYIPNCVQLGSSQADNSVFYLCKTGGTITVDVSLYTSNSGLPDADLAYAADNRSTTIIYSGTLPATNTTIGGVSATINTQAQIASKLGVSRARITNIQTGTNNDISFKVVGTYEIPTSSFANIFTLTSFIDNDNLVTRVNSSAFTASGLPLGYNDPETASLHTIIMNGCTQIDGTAFSYQRSLVNFQMNALVTMTGTFCLNWTGARQLRFPNLVNVSTRAFAHQNGSSTKLLYIPKPTLLGTTTGDDNVFNGMTGGCTIVANPSLQTSNAGGLEGDISYAQSHGQTVLYADFANMFTVPSDVTDLANSTTLVGMQKVTLTAPASTNAILEYQFYLNGYYKGASNTASFWYGDLVAGTTYKAKCVAVDIYGNRSNYSNEITLPSQTALSGVSSQNLYQYLRLDDGAGTTAIDSYGSQNGALQNGAAFSSAQSKFGGYSALFVKGTNQQISAGPYNFNTSFTVRFWYRSVSHTTRSVIFQVQTANTYFGALVLETSGLLNWYVGTYTIASPVASYADNTWHHVVLVRDLERNRFRMYIDGVVKEVFVTTGNGTANSTAAQIGNGYAGNFDGYVDEFAVYQRPWQKNEVAFDYNAGAGRAY